MYYIPTLTIAGSDCSGGAGIQADIKTMSALGCYAASVITSVTVQNTKGVYAIHTVPPEIVAGQIKAVMEDIHPVAIKIGMVNDVDTIHAISETLLPYISHSAPHIILDPVMVSSFGERLMKRESLEVFKEELIPIATLLTPNIPEAEALAGIKFDHTTNFTNAARIILSLGSHAVLIKGGHFPGSDKSDYLYMKNTGGELFVHSFPGVEVNTNNTHGTGCTLSSAICSFLAQGFKLEKAVGSAKEYVTEALKTGADVEIGEGHGPINHFFNPKKQILCSSISHIIM